MPWNKGSASHCNGFGSSKHNGASTWPSLCGPRQGITLPKYEGIANKVGRHVYRSLFAFDLERQAFILVGGEKSGKKGKTLYRRLIARADTIFERHLQEQRKGIQGANNNY